MLNTICFQKFCFRLQCQNTSIPGAQYLVYVPAKEHQRWMEYDVYQERGGGMGCEVYDFSGIA